MQIPVLFRPVNSGHLKDTLPILHCPNVIFLVDETHLHPFALIKKSLEKLLWACPFHSPRDSDLVIDLTLDQQQVESSNLPYLVHVPFQYPFNFFNLVFIYKRHVSTFSG
jgi:hypothetical protein